MTSLQKTLSLSQRITLMGASLFLFWTPWSWTATAVFATGVFYHASRSDTLSFETSAETFSFILNLFSNTVLLAHHTLTNASLFTVRLSLLAVAAWLANFSQRNPLHWAVTHTSCVQLPFFIVLGYTLF